VASCTDNVGVSDIIAGEDASNGREWGVVEIMKTSPDIRPTQKPHPESRMGLFGAL
jgi:hypothetical protein